MTKTLRCWSFFLYLPISPKIRKCWVLGRVWLWVILYSNIFIRVLMMKNNLSVGKHARDPWIQTLHSHILPLLHEMVVCRSGAAFGFLWAATTKRIFSYCASSLFYRKRMYPWINWNWICETFTLFYKSRKTFN